MKYQEQYLIDSLNKILSLQIDAFHELHETNSSDSWHQHNAHASILKRKQMMDQLMVLILSHRGKIDRRRNIIRGPHCINNGGNDQYITNDQLIELYRDIIEDDRISMGIKTTLSKHYEQISTLRKTLPN